MSEQTFYERILAAQTELKAPKNRTNAFGKYKYRSCEDILEAAKPVLAKNKLLLTISDSIVEMGGRTYIMATARINDMFSGDIIVCTAYAREATEKKGMDDSQISGCASSYARKYALNGLFCIDDTEDSDTQDNAAKVPQCADCGAAIKGSGAFNAQQIAQRAVDMFGRQLCVECAKKAKEGAGNG